jgi:protein-disulfide isomerase
MARSRKRGGVSWELVGIVAILGIFIVGGVYLIFSGGSSDEVVAPTALTTDEGLETGMTADMRPYIGSKDAPVTIYEFADFQCPHCRDFSREGARQMKDELISTGRAKLVWVNFPILGTESNEAAKGAVCASEQGQFWTFHDWLFMNQSVQSNRGGFSEDRLAQIASKIDGMDVDAFRSCLSDSQTAERVNTDKQFGTENSIQQTPSFLIGDKVVVGGAINDLTDAVTQAGG